VKHARYLYRGRVRHGRVEDGMLVDESGLRLAPDEVEAWLPPVIPNKMIGVALNYADHAEELGLAMPEEPVLFIKPNSSLVGHRSPVEYPRGIRHMHYEAELVAVIGRPGRNIHREEALDYVRGYTIANDVTVRDFVGNMYRPPIRAKGQDTFGPIGPFLVDKEDVPDPGQLAIRTYVNGHLRQEGHTSDMIFSVEDLIAFISSFMTLEPGDMIWTGTPKGISPVEPGDVMRVEIEGIGALENPVVLSPHLPQDVPTDKQEV
jgi:5-oxopent-3-ene-1,2,5-tricarboxylate decarboxylase / 2-hydroxyhepta-2,4-diene-1,7-dioate isomerase